jgi:hypothetical protein
MTSTVARWCAKVRAEGSAAERLVDAVLGVLEGLDDGDDGGDDGSGGGGSADEEGSPCDEDRGSCSDEGTDNVPQHEAEAAVISDDRPPKRQRVAEEKGSDAETDNEGDENMDAGEAVQCDAFLDAAASGELAPFPAFDGTALYAPSAQHIPAQPLGALAPSSSSSSLTWLQDPAHSLSH